ncbi:hypothetical protein [Thermococcus sp.]
MLVARELKENEIITDEEKAKKVILQGLPTIIRIAEKLWPENHDPEHLEKASSALYKGVENPLHILKQAGIDIELELEEFREFLAEISGKKIEGKESAPKLANSGVSPELLAIAKALEYSGFSSDALKRAEEDLLKRLDVLLENPEGNALEIAYTVKLLRLVQRGEVDKIRGFAK